jgi:hypothetical protein
LDALRSDPKDTAKGEEQVLAETGGQIPASTPRPASQPNVNIVQNVKPEAGVTQAPAGQPRPTPEAQQPTLPDAYRRAAIHQQWTDEQIDNFYSADPERAMQTFANIYHSNNNLSKQFSEFGQLKRQMDEQVALAQAQPVVHQPATPDSKPAVQIDIAGLKKEYGDDPIVGVVKQLADTVNQLSQKPDPVERPIKQPAPVYQPPRYNPQALSEVNNFFGSAELKQYKDFYGEGNDYDALTPGEFANRYKVAEVAGTIIAGASLKGEVMPQRVALERAHLIVSQPYLEKSIVSKLSSQLVSRSANLTIKPGGQPGGQQPEQKPVGDRDQAVRNAGERMRRIGL